MARVLVNDSTLTGIANAIRQKNGLDVTYKPSDMPKAISDIAGETPTGSTTITENGTYDIAEFAQAIVNVASSGGGSSVVYGEYTPASEKMSEHIIHTGLSEVHGFVLMTEHNDIHTEFAYKKLFSVFMDANIEWLFGMSTNAAGTSRASLNESWKLNVNKYIFLEGDAIRIVYTSGYGYLIPIKYKWVAW